MRQTIVLIMTIAFPAIFCKAQNHADTDTTARKNSLTIDGQLMSRGEYRYGGLPENEKDEKYASFIMERTRLSIDYQRENLEAKVTAQHSGVWGQSGKGTFNLYEAWVQMSHHNGLFAKVGRQELIYDDERIIGNNDWTMAAQSHDVLKLGYDSKRHQAHLILGYNQNSANIFGGTEYKNGAEPWKSMQTLWYHYNFPRFPLGISLLAMNVGTQNVESENDKTEYQQLFGTYLKFMPKRWKFEASFYYQTGDNEGNIPIDAWMAAVRTEHVFSPKLTALVGYDYLSGDQSFHVPPKGGIGLQRQKEINGFNLLFGSHHQFYGAMDFFYMTTYYGGFTPGLQNVYAGTKWKPISPLTISTTYHYFSTDTKVTESNWRLGHEVELSASYTLMKDEKISLGYSFMKGTETMERLKRVAGKGKLHWLWLTINVTPRFLQTKW